MTNSDRPGATQIKVDSAPNPGFLRAAIEAAMRGRAWPSGPEAQAAAHIAAAARAMAATGKGPRWR